MAVKNIRHTGIVVADMERSMVFYRDTIGLRPVIDFTEQGDYIDTISALEGVRLRMVKLVAEEGGMVELLQYQEKQVLFLVIQHFQKIEDLVKLVV